MVKIFSPNTPQMMTLLNPLDTLIPKIPFHFLGPGHPGDPGSVSVGFWEARQLSPFLGEGGSSQRALPPPPPPPSPETKVRAPK